jgi:hypothetical protein
MAFAPKRLFQGALSTTLTTVLYTNPGSVTTIVRDIEIVNTGTVVRVVTLAMPGSGAAHQLFAGLLVAAGETVQWTGHIVLASTETITGGQGTGTDVTVTISGAEG